MSVATNSPRPILRAERLCKVFGPAPERALAFIDKGCDKQTILRQTGCSVAVREVSFEVRRGELLVLMGLSGSGKSTVVRLLNGLIEPSRGTIEVDGRAIQSLSKRELRGLRNRMLSMVFQHFAIFPHRSVRENVAYGLDVRGCSVEARQARAGRAIEQVGLGGWEDAYPEELSGGMQQRVGLARALATDAEVMLMDEAFSALDPLIRREMQDLLIRLHRDSGRTIVFVTHDLNEAMRIGKRIMILRDGTISQIGTATEILSQPANDYISRFTADVDRTRVLMARDVMCPVPVTTREGDDPRDVLRRSEAADAATVFVVEAGTIVGTVSPAALRSMVGRGLTALERSAFDTDYASVRADTPLVEVCALSSSRRAPLAVIDEGGQLLGTLSADNLLAAIRPHRNEA